MGRPVRHFSRLGLVGIVLSLAVGIAASSAAAARADRLYPVAESYSPGDTATMVGYVDQASHGERRALFIESRSIKSPDYPAGVTRIEVGSLEVSHTANRLQNAYRVSADFVVPPGLEPGVYRVVYDVEGGMIGRLGASKLRVGVEPKKPIRRAWVLDEPEILNLKPDALIRVPEGTATASEIRNGSYFTERAIAISGPLGTRNLRIATPEDFPLATVGLELPEVPLVVEAVSIRGEESGPNAGWFLALAVVAFLGLTAADARDKHLNRPTRSNPAD